MPRVIRAADVDAVLAYGFDRSVFVDGDWDPGFRVAQDGRRRVLVFHDGLGEEAGLDVYGAELRAAGFHVVPDRQPGGGRRRLHVTRP